VYVTVQVPKSTMTPAGGAGLATTVNVGNLGHTTAVADAVAV
jgi:hypothetical protein